MVFRQGFIMMGIFMLFGGFSSVRAEPLDSSENTIIVPTAQSSLTIGYLREAKDYKMADTYSARVLAVTPYGGLTTFYEETIGEQRLQPWEQNVVTNGSMPRDIFNRENGRIRSGGLGYGFNHYLRGDNDFHFKLGYGEGRGYTYIDSGIPGHMDQTKYVAASQAGVRNIMSDLGASIRYKYGFEKNFSRFYSGTSDEVVITKQIGFSSSLPLIHYKVSIEPSLLIEHERSDVVNGDPAPGKILVDRVVAHQREELGLGLKFYQDYLRQSFYKTEFFLLLGGQRHEFEEADLDGFRVRLERGFGNSGDGHFLEPLQTWYVEYEQRLSNTYTEWPERDPTTGLPIVLEFSEDRRYHQLALGLSKQDDYSLRIAYEEPVKSGSTVARVDILSLRLPMANANLEYKEFSLNGSKRMGRFGISAHFAHEFTYSNSEAGVNITCFF